MSLHSGDVKPTPENTALANGSKLIIHEALHMETEVPGHGTVTGSIDMAKRCEASNLALVHMQRKVRRQVIDRMQQLKDLAGTLNVMVPEPGYRITL